MAKVKALTPDRLYRKCDLSALDFKTTEQLDDYQGLLGQPRAVAAVEFGIDIEQEGYNIFAFGPPGTGKHTAVRQYLKAKAASAPASPDLCYVNNFEQPHCPRLLTLPAGRGQQLVEAMESLIEELVTALMSALESDQYQTRRQALEESFEERQAKALSELGNEAGESGLALVRTPVGIVFAPVKGEDVVSPDDFKQLPEEERERLEKEIESFKEKLQKVLRQFPRWQREARDRVRQLNLEVSRFAVGPLFDEVREKFEGLDNVQAFLSQVENHVVENAHELGAKQEGSFAETMQALGGTQATEEKPLLRRCGVNLMVEQPQDQGAPVIYEDNPTYQNLVGRVEHIPHMGAAITDFNLIKPGALHRANGGYLLLDALKLLRTPYAYEGLKRALQAEQIKIESLGEAMSLLSTYSLEPEPVKLDVKVVLLGDSHVYYLLSGYDPEFCELFKVAADFAEQFDWTDDNQGDYVHLIAKLAREKDLKPLQRGAVERVIEHGARTVGDAEKMSLRFARIQDLLREADYWAGKKGREVIAREDVQAALEAYVFRSDRIRERIQEAMRRQTILVDTDGDKVGQVNGLSVLKLADFSFGQPSRITARVRLGKGEVINIEREVELSGPFHSKGVLILAGFLGARYAAERPLALSASLVFEQSYGGVDGDSASSAELYALLSAISGVPLAQSLAVTGSINQKGEVQAIGGANQKIEGFFDLCAFRGLTGDQGVMIPSANVKHLMLRQDVLEAVAADKFHIYPVSHVDEGIEVLTGVPAGSRDAEGDYPADSINRLVEARLDQLARTSREYASPPASTSEKIEGG